ncbi:MAG: hypothetical protein KAI66_27800 [Lentisphaeria bacterium]|nr:hypothetical protein [Lentisphaeria bacterium]
MRTFYQSDDGKDFDTADECVDYEHTLKKQADWRKALRMFADHALANSPESVDEYHGTPQSVFLTNYMGDLAEFLANRVLLPMEGE